LLMSGLLSAISGGAHYTKHGGTGRGHSDWPPWRGSFGLSLFHTPDAELKMVSPIEG
jgi:hypothetical protein